MLEQKKIIDYKARGYIKDELNAGQVRILSK